MREVAAKMNIKKADQVIDLVKKTLNSWNHFSKEQKVPDTLASAIKATLLI
jgi:hypothetical protein